MERKINTLLHPYQVRFPSPEPRQKRAVLEETNCRFLGGLIQFVRRLGVLRILDVDRSSRHESSLLAIEAYERRCAYLICYRNSYHMSEYDAQVRSIPLSEIVSNQIGCSVFHVGSRSTAPQFTIRSITYQHCCLVVGPAEINSLQKNRALYRAEAVQANRKYHVPLPHPWYPAPRPQPWKMNALRHNIPQDTVACGLNPNAARRKFKANGRCPWSPALTKSR
jgi:hypothetical protein